MFSIPGLGQAVGALLLYLYAEMAYCAFTGKTFDEAWQAWRRR